MSHIVIDEVHERSCDNDLLLSVCKQLLKRRRVKVILMSATLAIDALTAYFAAGDGCTASNRMDHSSRFPPALCLPDRGAYAILSVAKGD